MTKTACLPLLAAVAALLSSCALVARPTVPYASYPNIPDRPVSSFIRNAIKMQPWIDKNAFYGNYGGFGDNGGLPIDDLDEVFRRHDIVYNEARTFRSLCWADEAAAVAIAQVDPRRLSAAGQSFRERAYRFFTTPCWRWVGKPWESFFLFREKPDSPFRTRDQVFTFFALPDPAAASRFANGQTSPPPAQ